MKKFVIAVALTGVFALAVAQTGRQAGIQPDTHSNTLQEYEGGAHSPLIYTGSSYVYARAGKVATRWMQIGFAPLESYTQNTYAQRFAPNIFTLVLNLDESYSGDSVGLYKAWFNVAYDTAGTLLGDWGSAGEIWNGDSTNFFLQSGNYTHPKYGDWMYEMIKPTAKDLSNDTTGYIYALRVLGGNYLRLIFIQDSTVTAANGMVADTVLVNWILYCNRGS